MSTAPWDPFAPLPVAGSPGPLAPPHETASREAEPSPILINLADVEPQEIAWLWPRRIALGKLTVLAGDPGLGKSFLTIDLAARVTSGAAWTDGSGVASRGSVVLLNCEDDLADTVRPRLEAAGADVSRIVALAGVQGADDAGRYRRPLDLSRDLSHLAAALDGRPDCRLVIVDPISAYCGGIDSHNNAEVRGMLAPLAELAAARGVAVVTVTHLRKGEGAAIYRAMGSIAFVAAARAAYVVTRDRLDKSRRLFLPLKNNLGNDTDGLAFRVTSAYGEGHIPSVVWDAAPIDVTAEQSLTSAAKPLGRSPIERSEAEAFLSSALSDGSRAAQNLFDEARATLGLSPRTLRRAKEVLGIVAFRESPHGPWLWRLPDAGPRPDA